MTEWFLHRYQEAEGLKKCECGKTGIKHLFYMRMKERRQDATKEMLVGSDCVHQFGEPRAVALTTLLSRGVSVEFVRMVDGALVFKVRTKAKQNLINKYFPEVLDQNHCIFVKDKNKVVRKKHLQSGAIGKLNLKSELDEDPVKFFITGFSLKKTLRRVEEGPKSLELDINGARYTANPRRNIISKYPNKCPKCGEKLIANCSRIMPCKPEDLSKTVWICYNHIY